MYIDNNHLKTQLNLYTLVKWNIKISNIISLDNIINMNHDVVLEHYAI